MQIERILFLSFSVLLFLVVLPLAGFSFFSTRSLLEEEIGRNLSSDASMLMEQVDMLMFERMQNVHSWSHLDVMQEGRIGDIDKRLSQFLAEVDQGYEGMYLELFFADNQNLITAASKPDLFGRLKNFSNTNENKVKVPNGEVFIEDSLLSEQPAYEQAKIVIRAPVPNRYTSGDIGNLYGLFNMQQIFRLLDNASKSSTGDRYIVILDREGRAIASSSALRKPEFLLKPVFANWRPKNNETLFVHDGKPVTDSKVLAGFASSNGYQGYVQMGWSILIFQNTTRAFLPVRQLWILFTVVVIATLFLAFLSSHWISGRIAQPLSRLAHWVREVRYFEKQTPPHFGGTLEISELESAFGDMLRELERYRDHVIQTAKLAVVGEMAAIMAHEVRTPLGILSTSAQWLQKEQNLSPEGKEMAQFILDESARLNRLITMLLECARPREPQMREHHIHEIIIRAVDLLTVQANRKNLRIEQQLDANNPIIRCDFELLTQVFLNIIHNAIQIVPDNGLIHIVTTKGSAHITIKIADNGPGIGEDDYQRLFDPFFTKREGGVGLGLTVTRQIVLAHEGEISAAASEWGGACFTVLLPINKV